MKKILAFFLMAITTLPLLAQYNAPNAVTFEASTKSYYVLNNGDGSVIKLDSFFNTSKVISGLNSPQDILFGDIGTNKVLLVLDSMQIKVFDAASQSLMLSIPVPGAKNLRSGAIDKTNSNVFYLSDVDSGLIIKGTVGPPPFYQVSFTTLASGIDRPAGLLFDSKNRLLVVTDSTNGKILQVNTTSGKIDTLVHTGIDRLHSIREDAQGNYFVTNHGDSYLYRYNPALSSAAKLISYNKPSGMFINAAQDMMVLACTGCGRIYFNLLHLIAPLPVSNLCPGDSFVLSINPAYKGIGTFGAGNTFLIELSDSNGSFSNPLFIRTISGASLPSNIACKLPVRLYGNGHQIRIRANQPNYISSSATFFVHPVPKAIAYKEDEINACPKQNIQIGSAYLPGITYRWIGPKLLTDTTVSAPFFSSPTGGQFRFLLEVENGFGCKSKDSVDIEVAEVLKITGVPDTMKLCRGASAKVGQSGLNYVFSWSPAELVDNPSASQVNVSPLSDARLRVQFTDTSVGCSGTDSVELKVYQYPSAITLNDLNGCDEVPMPVSISAQTGFSARWTDSSQAVLSDKFSWNYVSKTGRRYVYLHLTNNALPTCDLKDSARMLIHENPAKPSIIRIDNVISSSVNGTKYEWYKNGVILPGSDQKQRTLTQFDNGFYQVKVFNASGCSSISDSLRTNVHVRDAAKARIKIGPVPVENHIRIDFSDATVHPKRISVINAFGIEVLTEEAENQSVLDLDVQILPSGVYFLNFYFENGDILSQKVVKHGWK